MLQNKQIQHFSLPTKSSFTKAQLKRMNFADLWLNAHKKSAADKDLALKSLEAEIINIAQQPLLSPPEKIAAIVCRLHSELHQNRTYSSRWAAPLVNFSFAKTTPLFQLNHWALRSVPLRAQRALLMWAAGQYPIVLLETIPSPWELLLLQAQGKRALSLVLNEGFLSLQFEERNYFEFILHDLIHADHFFAEEAHRQAQIGFCKFLVKARQLKFLDFLDEEDFKKSTFQEEFDYLIADMNSHCLHLLLTLKSLLSRYWKEEEKFNYWWSELMRAHARADLERILIDDHRDESARPLLNFFAEYSALDASFS